MPELPAVLPVEGPGLRPCRRASARRCAGKGKIFRQRREPGLYRIPLDISLHAREFLVAANQVIVAFVPPERLAMLLQHSDGLVSGKSFERPQPLARWYIRRDQKMNVIGHYDERMKIIASETAFAFSQRTNSHFRYFRLSQGNRAAFRMIQQAVHGDECLSVSKPFRREDTAGRETSVQTECDEHSFSNDVPMGEAAVVAGHTENSGDEGSIVSEKLRRAESRRQARRPAPRAQS
jgi:hypothetical protein